MLLLLLILLIIYPDPAHCNYVNKATTMASKKPKNAPTDDELDKMFEGIGDENASGDASKAPAPKTTKGASSQSEQELLAELENLGNQPPLDRPHTPRIAGTTAAAKGSSIKHSSVASVGSARTSEEKASAPRKSGESTTSLHTSFTPSATSSELQDAEKRAPIAQPAAASGGWWGGIMATASAAVKTAEAAVKEIQQNEEAKRWAEQVRGNVGALRGLGK